MTQALYFVLKTLTQLYLLLLILRFWLPLFRADFRNPVAFMRNLFDPANPLFHQMVARDQTGPA